MILMVDGMLFCVCVQLVVAFIGWGVKLPFDTLLVVFCVPPLDICPFDCSLVICIVSFAYAFAVAGDGASRR